MSEYEGRLPLFHQDLYRLAGSSEAIEGGLLDERQDEGVTLTEWAERLDARLDPERLDVSLDVLDDERRRIVLAAAPAALRALPGRRARAGPRARREPPAEARPPLAAGHRHRHAAQHGRRGAAGRPARGFERVEEAGHRHGALVLDQIAHVLAEMDVAPSELQAIGVGIGPGSFTGLRVGLATAKTLAWTLGIPLVGIATVDALRVAAGAGDRCDEPSRSSCRPAPATTTWRCRASRRGWCRPIARWRPSWTACRPWRSTSRRSRADVLRGVPDLRRRRPARGGPAGRERPRARPAGAARRAAGGRPPRRRGHAGAGLRGAAARHRQRRGGTGVVARPPLTLVVSPMTVDDIGDVHDIERASFPVPWPAYAFRQELETNRLARYLVVRVGDETVAYAGIWLMVDEAHVTTFAVLPAWRRHGIGARLMLALMELAREVGASVATLEVRLSNVAARNLYQRFGFRPVGVRPRYYSDNGEDALIMTTEPLDSPAMLARMRELSDEYGVPWLAGRRGQRGRRRRR